MRDEQTDQGDWTAALSTSLSKALLASRKAFEDRWEQEHGPWPHGDDVKELNWIATRDEAAKWWIRGFKEANAKVDAPSGATAERR